MFDIREAEIPSVVYMSEVIKWDTFLPETFDDLKKYNSFFWQVFFSKENFLSWLDITAETIGELSKIIVIVFPCVFALILTAKALYRQPNNRHNIDTVPLKIYKTVTGKTIVPIKSFFKDYICFLKEHKRVLYLWVVICFLILILQV